MGDDHISAALPGGSASWPIPAASCSARSPRALAVHELDDAALPVPLAVHARLHRARANAACVLRVQPRYLTALALTQGGRMALAHHNNLRLNDRVVYDEDAAGPTGAATEGERLAQALVRNRSC